VRDHGRGVPQVERERVFERFHRVEGANPNIPGAGLGLAIVREVARAHQGQCSIETTTEGTEVVVEFPAARA
jgi:two-component system sensor histidine kinase TctE